MRTMESRRLPHAVLAVGAVAAGVFEFSADDSAVQIVAWFVPLVMAVVLVARRYRNGSPEERKPLRLLLAGVLVYLLASLAWYLVPTVLKGTLPSSVDVGYFAAYLIYGGFVLAVIRNQRSSDDLVTARLGLVDALILTAAMLTIAWEAQIEQNLDAGAGGWALAIALGYPAFTVLLFGLGVRLAVTSGTGRSGAGILMVLWIGAEVAADVSYGYQGVEGTFAYGTSLSLLWMASYACLAALAVHPDLSVLLSGSGQMQPLTIRPVPSRRRGWGRLLVLYAAALVPVVLLAGHETHLTIVLASAVTFGLVVCRLAIVAGDQSEQRRLASHDTLTGLPNRLWLLEGIGRLLAEDNTDTATAQDSPRLAVICIDLDGFKQVNDTLGHPAGDQVLIEAAKRLHALARPNDVLARIGGDEFVVLCDGAGLVAPHISKRLLSAFDQPFAVAGREMFLSASAGIAIAQDGVTSEELLADADIAMYRAKKVSGSATFAFHPDMRTLAESDSRLHNELRRALERGQLRAVYQPIVDLSDGRIRGVEALLRWRHPELGNVPADVVVAAAERVGIAWELTCWIAREAATAVGDWNTSHPGHAQLRLAVNFTPLLLDDPQRIFELASHVTAAGLPIELLDVELTETAFVDPTPEVIASMAGLRGMGARLVMDDFGTGYSSMIALSNLPLDVLKIDRSFVTPLDAGGDSLLVSAMTLIARGRTMETVAEGIETERQLAAVIAAGCDLGQGYLFSRPLEREQLNGLAVNELELEFGSRVRQALSAGLNTPVVAIAFAQR